MAKYLLELVMKSGTRVCANVDDIEYSPRRGSLQWRNPEDWVSKLLHVDMNEVAAIVLHNPPALDPALDNIYTGTTDQHERKGHE